MDPIANGWFPRSDGSRPLPLHGSSRRQPSADCPLPFAWRKTLREGGRFTGEAKPRGGTARRDALPARPGSRPARDRPPG